jgi:predicted GIY-YIG superfamily endonuclease
MDTRFHGVYLLTSCDPHCKDWYYVGYTVDPARRLRQHNGELVNGAHRTSRRGRPWRLVLFVSGFSEDRAALRFEWLMQHPRKSRLTKAREHELAALTRLRYAVGALHLMLSLPPYATMALTLTVVDRPTYDGAVARVEQSGVATPAASALLVIRDMAMAEVRALRGNVGDAAAALLDDGEHAARLQQAEELGLVACTLCARPVRHLASLRCAARPAACPLNAHVACAAMWFFSHAPGAAPALLPTRPAPCPVCAAELQWGVLTQALKERINAAAAALVQARADELVANRLRYQLANAPAKRAKAPRAKAAAPAKRGRAPDDTETAAVPPAADVAPDAEDYDSFFDDGI